MQKNIEKQIKKVPGYLSSVYRFDLGAKKEMSVRKNKLLNTYSYLE